MTPTVKPFRFSAKANGLFLALIAIGIVSFVCGVLKEPQRAWAGYLTSYFFWLCISLCGVFFAALQHLTGAMWSATVRRIAEVFIGFIPVAIILFGIFVYGLNSMHHHGIHFYEWMDHAVMQADPILRLKTAYLNQPFFIIRTVILFLVVLVLGGLMVRNSIRQDATGDVAYTKKNVRLSAPFILIFAWAFTFAMAFDLMMSLTPHWFSTIFGIYCWAGLFESGLAMIMLFAIFLRRQGTLAEFVTEDHLHDLGKFLFAFTVFWAYIAFSQFMLIWYANLPEETFYFSMRNVPGWKPVTLALVLAKFVVPFVVLINRPAKRIEGVLIGICIWILAAQYLDVYWMIYPTFFKEGPVFGWMEIGTFLGFAGLFFLSVGRVLAKVSPVAVKDPYIGEALHHHQ